MGVSRDKAERVAEICIDRYFLHDYVQGVGVITRGLQDPNAPAEEKDEYCVYITLYDDERTPTGFSVPPEINGVKIYTERRPRAELY